MTRLKSGTVMLLHILDNMRPLIRLQLVHDLVGPQVNSKSTQPQ